MFRGTPHYPQRAKSSILTILTSHSKATQQNPPALQRNSTAHSAVVILTTQLLFYTESCKIQRGFLQLFRYHVAYLRLILSESESCVTGAEMTKKNSNRATLRYYSLLLIG